MQTLVLGGAGFIGLAVLEQLTRTGHSVTALTRRSPENHPMRDVVHWVQFDRTSEHLGRFANNSWDLIVDVTGVKPAHVAHSAGLLAGRAELYVYVSSCSVFEVESTSGTPTSLVGSGSYRYGLMKAKCEEIVRNFCPVSHLILRLPIVVGERDPYRSVQYWRVRAESDAKFLSPAPRWTQHQLLDVLDLSSYLCSLVERGHTGTLTLAPPAIAMDDFLNMCAEGAAERATWVDPDWLRTFVKPITELPLWHGNESRFRDGLTFVCDNTPMTGVEFRPLAETLARIAQSLEVERSDRSLSPLDRAKELKLIDWWSGR